MVLRAPARPGRKGEATLGAMIDERRSYVAGRWVDGDEAIAVENPADESQVAELAVTPLPEFERAITEGRRAFDDGTWASMAPTERARRVRALVDHVEANGAALVETIVAEAGQPTMFAEYLQLGTVSRSARSTIDLYLSMAHEEANPVPVDELVRGRVALSVRRHEPVGVVAAITPYNARHHHGVPEADPGADGRQLGDPAAEPADAHLVADLRCGRRGGRAAARRAERRGRGRRRRRGAAHDATRRSTWCRSPVRPRSGSRSWPRPRRR